MTFSLLSLISSLVHSCVKAEAVFPVSPHCVMVRAGTMHLHLAASHYPMRAPETCDATLSNRTSSLSHA